MSELFEKEKQILEGDKRRGITRRQQCKDCNTVLALEIVKYTGDPKIGFRSHSTYYWRKPTTGEWLNERWYGNWTQCPKCGKIGTLPIDKPLSAESILNKTDEQIEMAERINARINAKKEKYAKKGSQSKTATEEDGQRETIEARRRPREDESGGV